MKSIGKNAGITANDFRAHARTLRNIRQVALQLATTLGNLEEMKGPSYG